MADTATGEMPSGSIRRAYQQQCLTDTDRHDRTLAPWADQPPPDTDDREGEAESGPPGEIEKENKAGSNPGRSWHDIALIIISLTFAGHEHAGLVPCAPCRNQGFRTARTGTCDQWLRLCGVKGGIEQRSLRSAFASSRCPRGDGMRPRKPGSQVTLRWREWIRTFGSRTRHRAVRPRRGCFPV